MGFNDSLINDIIHASADFKVLLSKTMYFQGWKLEREQKREIIHTRQVRREQNWDIMRMIQ